MGIGGVHEHGPLRHPRGDERVEIRALLSDAEGPVEEISRDLLGEFPEAILHLVEGGWQAVPELVRRRAVASWARTESTGTVRPSKVRPHSFSMRERCPSVW